MYSDHCGKKEIDESDVRLGIHNRMDHSFTSPPPRDVSLEYKNKIHLCIYSV